MRWSIIPRDDIGCLAGNNWHIYLRTHMKEAPQKSEAPTVTKNIHLY